MANRRNILKLKDPELFDCFVARYHADLQSLRLQLQRLREAPSLNQPRELELIFTSVVYFAGPLNWTSADFCIAPPEDLLAVLYRSRILNTNHPQDEIDETLATYRLFVVPTLDDFSIQIIAHYQDFALNPID